MSQVGVLGGAEFRLPLLISLFGFAALSAVILNKAMSLIVVLVALPARLAAVPLTELAAHRSVAVNRRVHTGVSVAGADESMARCSHSVSISRRLDWLAHTGGLHVMM
ncbi:hypothetical protein [Streptosporangium sp. KLBMP 9127]|nr:hypothetical protein [Streptosporangium sp. KLBMP 9127]